jgi:hypothetical protein
MASSSDHAASLDTDMTDDRAAGGAGRSLRDSAVEAAAQPSNLEHGGNGETDAALVEEPLLPSTLEDLITDFLLQHDPARLPQAAGLAAQYADAPQQLQHALEQQYNAPRHFATVAFNFRSRFFDPLAALYDPHLAPPVPGVRPLDNLSKAVVVLPRSAAGSRAFVRLGVLHDEETQRRDAARRPGAVAVAAAAPSRTQH